MCDAQKILITCYVPYLYWFGDTELNGKYSLTPENSASRITTVTPTVNTYQTLSQQCFKHVTHINLFLSINLQNRAIIISIFQIKLRLKKLK